jgi:hypothetical protein
VLGSSDPRCTSRSRKGRSPRVTKVLALPISPVHALSGHRGTRRSEARNARPTALLHILWRTCGRREQEAGAGCPGEILTQLVLVTVEGTLVSRKTCSFAGSRRSGVLGRSVSFVGVSSSTGGRAGDSGVSPGRRGGERRQRARTKAYAPDPSGTARIAIGDASFTRSRNPRTVMVARSSARKRGREGSSRLRKEARGETTERARFDVGQTGETRRNRRRDWVVRMLRGSPRISTHHLRVMRSLMRQNRDGGCGLLPRTRGHVEPRPSGRTSWQLQKSSGVVGSRIRSRKGLPKEEPRE